MTLVVAAKSAKNVDVTDWRRSRDAARRLLRLSREVARSLQELDFLLNADDDSVCYVIEQVNDVIASDVTSSDQWLKRSVNIPLQLTEYRRKSHHPRLPHGNSEWCLAAVYPERITTTTLNFMTDDVGVDPTRKYNTSFAVPDDKHDVSSTKHNEDEHGLNKRQILVISTVSTVIGVFSIVALILRIRNYMKRNNQDKDSARRHVRALTPQRSRHHHGSLDHFATGHGGRHDRRWSQFNPFSADRL